MLVAVGLVGLGYISGSVPWGVLAARLSGRPDPRSVGSGRTGGTNAARALGWGGGLAVGILDVVKGAAPVLLARAVTGGWLGTGGSAQAGALVAAGPLVEALTGVAAMVGANRSIFLRFHGGRGVATGVGATLTLEWRVVAVAAPIFLATIGITRYVSLGSLIGTTAAMLALVLFIAAGVTEPAYLVYGLGAGLAIWLAHADNIARLREGTERRFSIVQDDG